MANSPYLYPHTGAPKKAHFQIRGAQPDEEQTARLTAIPFERTPPSGQEVKDALKWFCAGVVIAIFGWFFGGWVIQKFAGPGVLIFGYGAKFLAAPVALIFGFSSLGKLFRSARKKNAKDALQWMWMTSLLGEDAVGQRFGKPAYALSTLRRAVPKGFPFDERAVSDYIDRFRKLLGDAADETTVPAKEEPPKGWREGGAIKSCQVKEERELYPGAKELHAVITYRDCLSRSTSDNKTVTMVTATLKLDITQVFLCSGGYWFPYDLTPKLERISKEALTAAQNEAADVGTEEE